eukprot:3125469-Lingulodinium_polyedra.AAC.1
MIPVEKRPPSMAKKQARLPGALHPTSCKQQLAMQMPVSGSIGTEAAAKPECSHSTGATPA